MILSAVFLAFVVMAFLGLYMIWPALSIFIFGVIGASVTLVIAYNDRGKTQPAAEPADDTA